MTLIFKQLFAFLKMLNSETGQNQIAAGIAAGFILGMTPALSLQSLLVFLCILVFRIQAGAAFAAAFFFAFAAWLLDPVFHSVGAAVLETPSLQGLFTTMYNVPLLPLTRFNNTIVMGSAVITVAAFPFVFVISRILISRYRATVVARFKQTKFWKAIQATSFYKWYYTYDNLYG
ncbi:MAG TPA: TIGR03546 family protein [Bdellovibrionales bacterium]|nr:TIGR03546 family protein [Bdellovibrionales bacterium]